MWGDEVLLQDCSLERAQWMPEAVRLNTIARVILGENLENRNHVIQSSIQYLSYSSLEVVESHNDSRTYDAEQRC